MTYRYHKFGKHLVCLDQSIFSAVKTLGSGYDRVQLASLGISKSASRIAIKAVVKGKLGLLNPAHRVVLPKFGHLAMQVHRGHKIFDFDRAEVTKVFSHDISSQDAKKEVAASKSASDVSTAPRFIEADPDLCWFKEEYIAGPHATQIVSGPNSEYVKFYPDVEKCLLSLVGCDSPSLINTRTHIERLADTSFRATWLAAGIDSADIDGIASYLERLAIWLSGQSVPDELQLVLTHGDFSLVNAISTAGGLRFIDWEGVSPGGLYSDILNFLLVERYYGRASPQFLDEMSTFLRRYRQSVLLRYPELDSAAALEPKFARRLYYLERVSLLIGRDATENLRDVVRKTITMFGETDREMGDVAI